MLGGTGFLGKQLLEKLSKTNYSLKILIHNKTIPNNFKKFKGNILSSYFLEKNIKNCNFVINLIGQIEERHYSLYENIVGGINLLESCRKNRIKNIILISSVNVYGSKINKPSRETDQIFPQTQYGKIKALTEKIYEFYANTYGMNITVLRLSNLYGPKTKNGIVYLLLKSIFENSSVILSHKGEQYRDFIFVKEAAEGILKTIQYHKKGFNVYNIGSGKKHKINHVIKIIEKISNKKILVKFSKMNHDEKIIWVDTSKSKNELNFFPKTDLKKGLEWTISHW